MDISLAGRRFVEPRVRPVAVQNDHHSAIHRITLERYQDGLDLAALSPCLNVRNQEDSKVRIPLFADAHERTLSLFWKIDRRVTGQAGTLEVQLCFEDASSDVVWSSHIGAFSVLPSIEPWSGGQDGDFDPAILSWLEERIAALESNGGMGLPDGRTIVRYDDGLGLADRENGEAGALFQKQADGTFRFASTLDGGDFFC